MVEGVAEIDEIQGVILAGKTVGPVDLKSNGPSECACKRNYLVIVRELSVTTHQRQYRLEDVDYCAKS